LGAALARRLEARFGNHHHVGDIRGRGLFQAIELVADRGSKQAFDPAARLNVRIKNEALARGLICYPLGGTLDGRRGDHVLLAPPYIITEAQLDEAVDKLGQAVDAAIGSIAA
jgi:adenosylmethionine-8-amino-7-oxononanoate aminotransferase